VVVTSTNLPQRRCRHDGPADGQRLRAGVNRTLEAPAAAFRDAVKGRSKRMRDTEIMASNDKKTPVKTAATQFQ
jgi:hypothetical protein